MIKILQIHFHPKRPHTITKTRKNCFRYLKLMSPLNAAICTTTYFERQKCYGPGKKILFKKQSFDLEVKGPTYQISLTYLETKMLWPRQENTI